MAGQVYRCQNGDCGCEVRVINPPVEFNSNPRCSCGAEMQKPYKEPALRALHSDIEILVSSKAN